MNSEIFGLTEGGTFKFVCGKRFKQIKTLLMIEKM